MKWSVLLLASTLAACGGNQPEPEPQPELPVGGGLMNPAPADPLPVDAGPPDVAPPAAPDPDDPRSQETVRRVIQGNHQNIVACANANANRAEPIVGSLKVAIRVEADGSVGDVDLVEPMDEPDFEVCLRREIRTLVFPPATKRIVVRYPFSFRGR